MSTSAEIRPIGRDVDTAVRLYMQHWLYTTEAGFLIHPEISLDRDNLRVADVGCGTGIWLIDLDRQMPRTGQLHGYDISSAYFPPADELPNNIRFNILDATQSPPAHLIEQYDVVHLGHVGLYIRNEDPSDFLRTGISMLKPGGYVCWDELDLGSIQPIHSDPLASHGHADLLESFGLAWLSSHGVTTRWLRTLDETCARYGLEVIDFKRQPASDSLARPWTMMQLMANRDYIENEIIPMTESGSFPQGHPTAAGWREMLGNLVQECQGGVKLLTDIVYIVAKKRS